MNIIPLSKNYSATFRIDINNEIYDFRTLYNSRFGNWSFDLTKDNIEIASGVSMILGDDIIEPYDLGSQFGSLFMADLELSNVDADESDIGSRVVLVHINNEDIEDALTV